MNGTPKRTNFQPVKIRSVPCERSFNEKRERKAFSLTLSFFLSLFSSFRKAREDLDAKSQKLAEMEADYGDVVPRRDFERLEAQFNVSVPFTVFPKRKAETVKT